MFQTGLNHWNLPPKGRREKETKEKANVIKSRKEKESNPKAWIYWQQWCILLLLIILESWTYWHLYVWIWILVMHLQGTNKKKKSTFLLFWYNYIFIMIFLVKTTVHMADLPGPVLGSKGRTEAEERSLAAGLQGRTKQLIINQQLIMGNYTN